MAIAVNTLIQQARRFARDYPEIDATTASIASNGTTLSVADTTIYARNWNLQLDTESVEVASIASATTLTIRRAAQGTTAASHASAATILVRPAYLDIEYLDALNYAQDQTYPYIYREVDDTSLTTLANTYEYTIPTDSVTAKPIRGIYRVQLKISGTFDYRATRSWTVLRGTTPKIQFRHEPIVGANIRIHGYGYFADLAFGGNVDTKFPEEAANTLLLGAVEYLAGSGEMGRIRVDTGVIDAREQANRPSAALSLSNAYLSRFERSLLKHAMPPLPKNVQRTI